MLQKVIVPFYLLCPELTRFDDKGDKTNIPDKERQIEAFQLLFMLLPAANRSLLKLLFDLLYHTACNQQINKMSAINLATMFAPHIIWPKNVRAIGLHFSLVFNYYHLSICTVRFSCLVCLQVLASDLQGDIEKLNNCIAFLIRHSQKLFKVIISLSSLYYCLASCLPVVLFKH